MKRLGRAFVSFSSLAGCAIFAALFMMAKTSAADIVGPAADANGDGHVNDDATANINANLNANTNPNSNPNSNANSGGNPVGTGNEDTTDKLGPNSPRRVGYWASGATRPFVSGIIDTGYLYLRPRVSFGYGKPFDRWVGLDVNAIVNDNGYGAYSGIRGALPLGDLRIGARPFASFRHTPLTPLPRYDVLDLNTTSGTPARIVTFEAELSASHRLGPGAFLTVLSASYLVGAPAGTYIYEETLHIIVAPPWVTRTRIGYALKLGAEGNASLGVVAEVLYLPGRHDYVVRAGLLGTFVISDHLEAIVSLVPPIRSPDSLGAAGGDFAQLGIRYRFATGEGKAPLPL